MDEKTRPSWLDFWFDVALMYSTRGTCDRLRTACLIVKANQLVGAGYNGSVPGTPHCDDVGHLMIDGHCERTLHAEENAIVHTDRDSLKGSVAYIIGTPCIRCAKLLVSTGVCEINYLGEYTNSRGKEFLAELSAQTGVRFIQHNLDPWELLSRAVMRLKGAGGALHDK